MCVVMMQQVRGDNIASILSPLTYYIIFYHSYNNDSPLYLCGLETPNWYFPLFRVSGGTRVSVHMYGTTR